MFCLPAHRPAFHLVVSTAAIGMLGCLLGFLSKGLLGLGAGLTGSWLLFLAGLVALYLREQQLDLAAQRVPVRALR